MPIFKWTCFRFGQIIMSGKAVHRSRLAMTRHVESATKGFMVWDGFSVIEHLLNIVHSVSYCIVDASIARPSRRNCFTLRIFDKTTLQSNWIIFEEQNVFVRTIIKVPKADPWGARRQDLLGFKNMAWCMQSAFLRGLKKIRHSYVFNHDSDNLAFIFT